MWGGVRGLVLLSGAFEGWDWILLLWDLKGGFEGGFEGRFEGGECRCGRD